MTSNAYPLEHRNITPGEGGTLLTGKSIYGMSDGLHTGGAWLMPDGYVYKPLDGKPYPNANYLIDTEEEVALEALQNIPLFPKNWVVQTKNNRRWLVRQKAYTYYTLYSHLDKEQILQVEKSVREVNELGWEIGDYITLGLTEDESELFILDLSIAHFIGSDTYFKADDSNWILHFFDVTAPSLKTLRVSAEQALNDYNIKALLFKEIYTRKNYIYASFNRPVEKTWATLSKTSDLIHQKADPDNGIPFTWILTEEPLSDKTIYGYELVLGAWK